MGNGKKILFISYDGMTDPLGQSQVIPYLQGLSKNGYKIFLLSCEKSQVFLQNKAVIEDLVNPFDITWVPLSYTKNPPLLSTIADIIKLRQAAKKIHKAHALDMVHTRPGVPALVGLWMKRKFGIKFLNDIREFYADSRVDGNMWDIKNPLFKKVYQYFKKKESQAVQENDGIVCLTYAAEKIIHTWPEYNKAVPLEVIPCSADMELFNPDHIQEKEKQALRTELDIRDSDFVISYLGSVGGWYLTDEMLQFCKALSDKIPAAKFLFISPHRHDEIRAAAVKHRIDSSKIITKKAGRSQVPLLLSLSRFSIFFIKPCYSKQSSSPTKHGEIMAMGIPLITNSGVGDVEMIVEQYHSGIVIHSFDETEYAKAASAIAAGINWNTDEIRKGANEFYSLQTAVEKYNRIYNNILMH
jgi:glycosyltransferase involved in cell wall biosynthesis